MTELVHLNTLYECIQIGENAILEFNNSFAKFGNSYRTDTYPHPNIRTELVLSKGRCINGWIEVVSVHLSDGSFIEFSNQSSPNVYSVHYKEGRDKDNELKSVHINSIGKFFIT